MKIKQHSAFRLFLFEIRELLRFQKLKLNERDIVFYSESGSYWIYFEPFIKHLIEEHKRKICYLTSAKDDPVLKTRDDRIRAFYIGEKTIRTIFFAALKANILVMTLPGLNKYHIRRSKHFPVHYVFVPHNMNSTHMVFRKGSHDHFDTIFCVGPHHYGELREAEEIYKLKPRSLIKNGYVRLDTIYEETQKLKPLDYSSTLKVLIAPSWGKESLLEKGGADGLVENLLNAGHHVIVRPHRDSIKQAKSKLNELKNRFFNHNNFSWEEGGSSNKSLFQSHLLITDWSGSAFSFSFGLERPVLFIDVPQKVNNPEYTRFQNQPLEVFIREEIGAVLPPDDFQRAAKVVEKLCKDQKAFSKKIRPLREKWVYNFNSSAEKGAAYLVELSDRRKKEGIFS